MNKNAKRWIRALRSGKFKQGTSYLHQWYQGAEYCCLGVACELYQKSVGDLVVVKKRSGVVGYSRNEQYLPKKVKDWLGLTTRNGENNQNLSLAQLNDHGSSFEYIANIIESEPEGLFK